MWLWLLCLLVSAFEIPLRPTFSSRETPLKTQGGGNSDELLILNYGDVSLTWILGDVFMRAYCLYRH